MMKSLDYENYFSKVRNFTKYEILKYNITVTLNYYLTSFIADVERGSEKVIFLISEPRRAK